MHTYLVPSDDIIDSSLECARWVYCCTAKHGFYLWALSELDMSYRCTVLLRRIIQLINAFYRCYFQAYMRLIALDMSCRCTAFRRRVCCVHHLVINCCMVTFRSIMYSMNCTTWQELPCSNSMKDTCTHELRATLPYSNSLPYSRMSMMTWCISSAGRDTHMTYMIFRYTMTVYQDWSRYPPHTRYHIRFLVYTSYEYEGCRMSTRAVAYSGISR